MGNKSVNKHTFNLNRCLFFINIVGTMKVGSPIMFFAYFLMSTLPLMVIWTPVPLPFSVVFTFMIGFGGIVALYIYAVNAHIELCQKYVYLNYAV